MSEFEVKQAHTDTGGNIPEGIWVLNQARSRKLVPASHTLWIIKDDGRELIWSSAETTSAGIQMTSYASTYDGPAVVVTGSGFLAHITSEAPGTLLTQGEVPGMGPFSEACRVVDGGRRMLCDGRVETTDGELTWFEEFDWHGPSPHQPLAA